MLLEKLGGTLTFAGLHLPTIRTAHADIAYKLYCYSNGGGGGGGDNVIIAK